MDAYALVLNAGSSSLEFCVYRSREPQVCRVACRGQIDGIGTSPSLSAKDETGALEVLAAWLRSLQTLGLSAEDVEAILYKQSGLRSAAWL